MDLNRWKRRRFIPTWGDNHEEDDPCVVVFAPPTVGWMSRWREIVSNVPSLSDEEAVKSLEQWTSGVIGFRSELFSDLILGVEGLTMDGKAVSREQAIEFIQDNEALREEVFLAIIAEGTVSKDEGKG
jgi:hypothetical protein